MGALHPPIILRATPQVSSFVPGDPILVDTTVVGIGEFDSQRPGTLEESAQQLLRLESNRASGPVTLSASNSGGYHEFRVPIERLTSAPLFRRAEDTLRVEQGRYFTLPILTVGTPPLDYSVYRNDFPLVTNIKTIPVFARADATSAGQYRIEVRNPHGTAEHTVTVTVSRASRLSNLSVRAKAGYGENRLILGHVLQGGSRKETLLRAIGPTLAANYGVSNALQNPRMLLRDADGVLLLNKSQNESFGDVFQRIKIQQLGAFESQFATEPTLFKVNQVGRTGIHLLEVSPDAGDPGITLAEIYDADAFSTRLINLSARAPAGQNAEAIMAGFVIAGDKALPAPSAPP